MGLSSMFSTNTSPIAIDFGSSSVKLLQISPGQRPEIIAAAELQVPDTYRMDPQHLFGFYAEQLPRTLDLGKFKGKRAIIAVPSAQTFIQHMQIAPVDGVNCDDLVKGQLNSQMGCLPDSVVVRSVDVGQVHDGEARGEVICFAISRDTVMRHIELLRKCKLEAVGVHTETMAIVRSFDHLNRRDSDVGVTTLYVDLGWGGTRAAIAHGKSVVFARYIQIGGRHFDQIIAKALNCDLAHARAHRMSLEGPVAKPSGPRVNTANGGESAALLETAAKAFAADPEKDRPPAATAEQPDRRVGMVAPEYCHDVEAGEDLHHKAANVDLTELLDTIADELSMCLRYHQGLFPDRAIDRAIFLGGEARQVWMCQHVVKSVRVPAQLGDPLARMSHEDTQTTPGLNLEDPQPGWSVACGLCTSPTDL